MIADCPGRADKGKAREDRLGGHPAGALECRHEAGLAACAGNQETVNEEAGALGEGGVRMN